MKILILEDDPYRHRAFQQKLIGHQVRIVETSTECIEALQQETWDWLFLDHDLGGKVFVESGKDTGYEVAEWLSRQDNIPKNIIIHSLNSVGAENMNRVLPEARLVPFAWKMIAVN